MTLEELDKYKNATINEININDLDDIDEIEIDENKSEEERIMDFLDKTRNPYFFNISKSSKLRTPPAYVTGFP